MQWRARVASLASALALALGAGCSNPRCWTHDPEEVAGGCSLGGGGGGGGGSYDAEAHAAHDRQVIALYDDDCAAGDAVACWLLGDAQSSLGQPAPVVEASYAAACRGGLREVPSRSHSVCIEAGDQAQRPGGSGAAAALGYYLHGCELGDVASCDAAMRVDPALSPDVALAACRRGSGPGCERVVAASDAAAVGARLDPAIVLEATRRGCTHGSTELCIRLGLREVAGR